MRLLVLKLILTLFAMLGLHFPAHVYLCDPGHGQTVTPSNCEWVRL